MKSQNPEFVQIDPSERRHSVDIILPDGRIISGPRGAPVEQFLRMLPEWRDHEPIIGAIINSELRELTYTMDMEARVQPVTTSDSDGALIYRRSLTFLLEAAFEELFPEARLDVDHSVASGGYFCMVSQRDPLSNSELADLENHMRKIVKEDIPFRRTQVPIEEAIAYFRSKSLDEKVRLLKYRSKDHLVLYHLGKHVDYHHGYMVPRTSFLKWFGLEAAGEGFVLRFPRRNMPDRMIPLPDTSNLLATFRQYRHWLGRLAIDHVGALNSAIEEGRIREIILVSEALHERKISEIASQISQRRDQVRVILIAGPSSSGKTTFSKRLSVQLMAQGISPFALEMDNYFVDRELTPLDENGEYDFEVIEALDTELLQEHLHQLIAGKEVHLPSFDFKSGKRISGEIVRLVPEQVIILEGIHGLNPGLIPNIPGEQSFRLYASCLTQLNLDRYNRISTTDTRLIRRIVRDARERGYSATDTIRRWESVRRGEKRHIYPYQENADEMFNSALVFELAALKPLAEPLLRQVNYGEPEHIEAKRLLAFLEWFLPLQTDLIPDNSLIREFIGGSIFKDFRLWDSSSVPLR
jgi:uridine kinase